MRSTSRPLDVVQSANRHRSGCAPFHHLGILAIEQTRQEPIDGDLLCQELPQRARILACNRRDDVRNVGKQNVLKLSSVTQERRDCPGDDESIKRELKLRPLRPLRFLTV
jgi:hypothetical protein